MAWQALQCISARKRPSARTGSTGAALSADAQAARINDGRMTKYARMNSSQRQPDSQASSAIHVSPATDVSSRLLLGQGRWSSFRAGEGRRLTDHSRERLQMKRFLMLTALAVGLGVGAAH